MDPLASEITLVNTSTGHISSKTDIVFTFSEDDPGNSALYSSKDPSAKPAYTVVSEWGGLAYVTRVLNSSGEEIASLERHDSLGDEVTLPANPGTGEKKKSMKLSNWMHGGIFQSSNRAFQDKGKRKYQWEGYAPYCNLILRAKDHPEGPIAQFQKSHTPSSSSSGTEIVPATLTLTPRAQEIQDTVVVSLLFLERNRRSNVEKTYTAWTNVHRLRGDASTSLAGAGYEGL